jgi:hypothetical protein
VSTVCHQHTHTIYTVLICELPRDHGVSPTHSFRIVCVISMDPHVHSVSPHTRGVLSASAQNSSNQLQLIATDTPNTF